MRIGIDARAAMKVNDGIGRYATELLREFAARDLDHEYIVLKNAQTKVSFAFDARFREIVVPADRFSIQEQAVLPRVLNPLGLDLFHSLHFAVPLWYRGAMVATVHDILPVMNSWSFGRGALRNALASTYVAFLVRQAVKRCRLVLVDSDNTLKDMTKHLGTDPGRLQRVYLGSDHAGRGVSGDSQELLRRLGLQRPFLLSVTNFKPHKNTGELIEAVRLLRRSMPDLQLGIIGANPRGFAEQHGTTEQLAREGVHILGYLDDGLVDQLMSSATVFVYPSRYEGFGFPVVEAMRNGAPVVSSDAASLPELGGDAVVYVHPGDPEALARTLAEVSMDPRMQESLRTRGRSQAEKFTWRRTATETLLLYDEALSAPRGGRR
jgi:glycosyltransferase involved in cell wall biosynthesis